MKKLLLLTLTVLVLSCSKNTKDSIDFTTQFEKSAGKETPEYKDVISYYENLADAYSEISVFTFGQTDAGEPLHLVTYNREGI